MMEHVLTEKDEDSAMSQLVILLVGLVMIRGLVIVSVVVIGSTARGGLALGMAEIGLALLYRGPAAVRALRGILFAFGLVSFLYSLTVLVIT